MYLMARTLAEQGVNVSVATTDDDGPGRRIPENAESTARYSPFRIYRFPKQSEFYKVSLPLCRWLAAHVRDYDLVHVHAIFSFPSVAGAWFSRWRRIPYIIRPIGVLERYGMTSRRPRLKALSLRFVEAPLLRDAAILHFTSDAERDQAEDLGIELKSAVVPLGVESHEAGDCEEFLRRNPFARDRRRILFLSRIDPKKNLEGLIRAMPALLCRDGHPVLFVAGNGPDEYLESLRSLAVEEGVADSVVWLGHLSGNAKRDAFAAADVFVLPSLSENFGIAAAEALAAGIPCVLGRGVAIAAEVAGAGAGIAVDPTPSAIADGITHFLCKESYRHAASVAARHLASEKYSTRRMGEELIAVYERILVPHRLRHA